jgi:SAM-dependent methyltransferase
LNELESLYAIALACFNSHYVYFETAKEKAEIENLCDLLEAKGEDIGEELERHLLLIYSAYRPPMSLSNYDILSSINVTNPSENFRNWRLQTITQPHEEIALAKSIAALTSVKNDVSMRVKVQYDENPYPRWFQAPNVKPHTPAQMLRKIFVHFNPPQQLDGACPILVAGCGSGWHAVLIAKLYPQSQITALDLSRTNLAFALRRTKELNITNIDYFQGDILSLGKLELSFPYVESVGVLHHLGDPITGWKVLADITQPGGIMHIGLYSEHARKKLNEAGKIAAAGNYKSNKNDIRRFRQEVFSLPSKSKDMQKLVRNREFYSMSSCRDLLFHAQEHRFTIDQIQHALNQLGLEFIGFQINGIHYAEMYRQNFPDDPKMTHLENWKQIESAHPDVFNRQYDFYCRKLG